MVGILGVVIAMNAIFMVFSFEFVKTKSMRLGISRLLDSVSHSTHRPVIWDGESKGKSTILGRKVSIIDKNIKQGDKEKSFELKKCVFDQNRECTAISTCHVDGRACSSSRRYLNKSFSVIRDTKERAKFLNDIPVNSNKISEKKIPPMEPKSTKDTTISSRRHNSVDLEVKGTLTPIDSYLMTTSNTIVLDFEKLSKDLGSYILPNPTLGKNQVVNVVSNGFKVACRVATLFVDSIQTFLLTFQD